MSGFTCRQDVRTHGDQSFGAIWQQLAQSLAEHCFARLVQDSEDVLVCVCVDPISDKPPIRAHGLKHNHQDRGVFEDGSVAAFGSLRGEHRLRLLARSAFLLVPRIRENPSPSELIDLDLLAMQLEQQRHFALQQSLIKGTRQVVDEADAAYLRVIDFVGRLGAHENDWRALEPSNVTNSLRRLESTHIQRGIVEEDANARRPCERRDHLLRGGRADAIDAHLRKDRRIDGLVGWIGRHDESTGARHV